MEYKRKVDKKRIPTCNIMGVNIAAINMEWLVDYLEKNISEIKGDYICVSNVHTTVTSFEDADYCAIQNGGLMAIPDGGPLSTVGQKRGHKNMERTTGPSLMGEIFEISAKKGYRHYFYTPVLEYKQRVYGAWSKDKKILKASSSGGVFVNLAKEVLKQGGVVCATRFENDFAGVIFDSCDCETDLSKFCGSKYIQSTPKMIYKDVKKYLINKRRVLFVGTGCQVAGLKSYLGKSDENLLCVDLICHGVPSPLVWRNYIAELTKKHNANGVKCITFRKKKPSWKEYSIYIEFDNGKKYEAKKTEDPYLIAFAKDYMLRPSCEHCKYACVNREGDITLADFWGYRSFNYKTRNKEKGISCCIINSDKGMKAFNEIKNQLVVTDKNMEEAIRGNRSLVKPWSSNPQSEEFWKLYEEKQNDALFEFCRPYKNSAKMKMDWFIQDHLWMIPKPILRYLLKRKE